MYSTYKTFLEWPQETSAKPVFCYDGLLQPHFHPGKTNQPSKTIAFWAEPHIQGASANAASLEYSKKSTAHEGNGFTASQPQQYVPSNSAIYMPGFKNSWMTWSHRFSPSSLIAMPNKKHSLHGHCHGSQSWKKAEQPLVLWTAVDYAGAETPTAAIVSPIVD